MFVSIVLTTYNRPSVLERTLALYGGQKDVVDGFEVIVVDDASNDSTSDVIERARSTVPYRLVTHRLAVNSGPSKARNLGLDLAQGEVIVFSGDDILPSPDFVAKHRDWHRHIQPGLHAAMVGRITWAPELDPTPFLHWLETMGTQFHYGDMQDAAVVKPDRFYTSNVSIKRKFLDQSGERFDERLRFCEDSEFASRLARHGMTLHYHAAAQATHLHPTSLSSSLRRMQNLGAAVADMEQTSPETFARVTAGVLDQSAGWRGRMIRLALSRQLRRGVYQPLAAWCERRIFADRIFALAHASAMLEGVMQHRKGSAV